MTWTKIKTATLTGAVVLSVASLAAYSWQKELHRNPLDSSLLDKLPDNYCMIVPTTTEHGRYGDITGGRMVGFGLSPKECIRRMYNFRPSRIIFSDDIHFPTNRFDFIGTLTGGLTVNRLALQKEAEKKFGIVSKTETRPTDVLLLKVKTPNAAGLKINDSGTSHGTWNDKPGTYQFKNVSVGEFTVFFEDRLGIPVMDETGLTNRFDFDFNCSWEDLHSRNWGKITPVLDKLGLELVPTNMPIEVLVVGKKAG